MSRIFAVVALLGLTLMSATGQNKNLYVVTHVDIIPGPGGLADPIKWMQEFAADSRKDPGAVRFEVLQQDRPNHFTIIEVWQSKEAFDAHTAAEHTKRFREKLAPRLGSPFDERLHNLVP
jgi:quinol monooxygenase YgiN